MLPLTKDRAICAIASVTWATYSDISEHTMPPLDGLTKSLFDRCVLFLNSHLPYAWERDNFIAIWGSRFIVRKLSQWRSGTRTDDKSRRPGPESSEDWSVWPFISTEAVARAKRELNRSPLPD